MPPEKLMPDGTWVPQSWEELEAEDPDAARSLRTPIPDSPMTEGERYLYNKMQAEGETSAALFAAGLTLDDLVVEDDDSVAEAGT